MKKAKKVLTLVACAVLLVCISVGATIAYLTSGDTVTNTFSVGKVLITMDELDVDEDDNDKDNVTYVDGETTTTRDKANDYHLYPGKTFTKDPIVHIDDESEDCWIFVKLENGIKDIQDTVTIEDQIVANGWKLIEDSTLIYAYKEVVSAGDDIPVFENFKIKGDVTNETLALYENAEVKVTAYAVQAAEFEQDAQAAWDAAYSQLNSPALNPPTQQPEQGEDAQG